MPISFPDILQHGNSQLGLVNSDFVVGGIRTKVANLAALYAIVDATTPTASGQVKDYATMVYVESEGTYYVLKDRAQIGSATGWETLSSLIDVATSPSTITVSVDGTNASRPVLFASGTTGAVSIYTDPGITYNPSTNLLTVTASAAAKWSSDITLSVTGPVTGSVAFDGATATETLALTLANNAVTLGTHTTGNYIATATAGTGISVSGSGSETAAITITNTDLGLSLIHI